LARWAKSGVLQKVFLRLQEKDIMKINVSIVSLDSTSIKVHPDGTGTLKNMGSNPLENLAEDGIPKFIWSPHLIGTQQYFLFHPAKQEMLHKDATF
jgi:hypothetical protein